MCELDAKGGPYAECHNKLVAMMVDLGFDYRSMDRSDNKSAMALFWIKTKYKSPQYIKKKDGSINRFIDEPRKVVFDGK